MKRPPQTALEIRYLVLPKNCEFSGLVSRVGPQHPIADSRLLFTFPESRD